MFCLVVCWLVSRFEEVEMIVMFRLLSICGRLVDFVYICRLGLDICCNLVMLCFWLGLYLSWIISDLLI